MNLTHYLKQALSKRDTLFLILIGGLSLTKLIQFNQGLVSVEPDEANHVEVIRSLKTSFYPTYHGAPIYYFLPLYPFVSMLVSYVVQDEFLALRLVSLGASILTSLLIFWYIRRSFGSVMGFIGSVLFILLPINVFYSRLGLIETTLVALSLAFLLCFTEAVRREKTPFFVASGILLGLSVLTKYTALMLFSIPALVGMWYAWRIYEAYRNKKPIPFSLFGNLVLMGIVALSIFVPFMIVYFMHDPMYFKQQLRYILGFSGKKSGIGEIISELPALIHSFSAPVLLLVIPGVIVAWKRVEFRLLLLAFAICSYVIIPNPLALHTVRYFYFLSIFVALFASLGIVFIGGIAGRYKNLAYLGVFLALLVGMAPSSYAAFHGANHTSIREAALYLRDHYPEEWVFTNYWPTTFAVYSGNYQSTWLSRNRYDTNAFATDKGSIFSSLPTSSAEFVRTHGGIVVVRLPYDPHQTDEFGRLSLAQAVRTRSQKIAEFRDTGSFFPYPDEGEVIEIYKAKPGDIYATESGD